MGTLTFAWVAAPFSLAVVGSPQEDVSVSDMEEEEAEDEEEDEEEEEVRADLSTRSRMGFGM